MDKSATRPAEFTSQCGEDRWIWRNWTALGLPTLVGSDWWFVEVGAGDGKTFSNTYWLDVLGMRGLLCEPDPRHKMVERPNCIVERVAVGRTGAMYFGMAEDPYLSGAKRTADAVHPRLRADARILVRSLTLTALLKTHDIKNVALLSIDTEGTELEAWNTLDLDYCRPLVVIIETDTWGLPDNYKPVCERMFDCGYAHVHQTKYNAIFSDNQ